MWCRSAVNFSFFLCLAACRTRPSAWVTRSRPCVRSVLRWSAFLSVSGLGSTDSAADRPALFVGIRDYRPFAAQWLACTLPCRRFADVLANVCARLGADVGCYSFIAVDSHHLLLAGLPAH